jgi:Ser/Thr protein kinase RdoA (MazF antagonist)
VQPAKPEGALAAFPEKDIFMQATTAETAANPLLTATTPQAGDAEAEAIGRRYFGITARAHRLTSERDLNFHLVGADGAEYVLKITNAAEDAAVTDFQTKALLHIAARNPDLLTPHVFPTVDGGHEAIVTLAGERHIVRLLSYLKGEPQHRTPTSPGQRAALGRCLAEIGKALADFRHPAADHDILWDLKRAGRLEDLLVHIASDERRALAAGFIDAFKSFVVPALPTLRSQVVHNDFNPHNVLVDPADPARVTGVLDFGDMVETPLVVDVAVGCSYQVTETGGVLDHAADFVAAYHAENPLREDEVEVLFDLIAMRHVMTVAITEWRAGRYPENRGYILRNNPRAVAGMKQFATVGRDEGRAVFRRACGME